MKYERIRERRRQARVSQTELGIALGGRSQMYVARLERGLARADDATIKRALAEIKRIALRKKAIAEAQREAAERVVRELENPTTEAAAAR